MKAKVHERRKEGDGCRKAIAKIRLDGSFKPNYALEIFSLAIALF